MSAVQPLDVIPEAAARTGLQMARKVFAKRGDHTEAHVSEKELAVMLAAAFHLGTSHRDDAYPKLVAALRKVLHPGGAEPYIMVENGIDARREAQVLLRELGEAS